MKIKYKSKLPRTQRKKSIFYLWKDKMCKRILWNTNNNVTPKRERERKIKKEKGDR